MKTSQYLKNKCDNLYQTISYFIGENSSWKRTATEKRLTFLAQIDFWDWEMEELLYSFDSFSKRAELWKEKGLKREFAGNEFLVRMNQVNEAEWNRSGEKYWNEEVVAPIEELNRTVDRWNKLLDICEKRLFTANANKQIESCGIKNATGDLGKYVKLRRGYVMIELPVKV